LSYSKTKKVIQEYSWFIKESFIFSYKVITNSSKKSKDDLKISIYILFI